MLKPNWYLPILVALCTFGAIAGVARAASLGDIVDLLIALHIIPAEKAEQARKVAAQHSEQGCVRYSRDLSVGSVGEDVARLQSFLEAQGLLIIPRGVVRGYFGPLTEAALARYQGAHGLPATGMFDQATRDALYAVQCKTVPSTGTDVPKCGTAADGTQSYTSVPTSGLCAVGTPSSVVTAADIFWWTCRASSKEVSCHVPRCSGGSVEGACGNTPPVVGVSTVVFTASPVRIMAGEGSTLTWAGTNVASCQGSGFSTGGKSSGSVRVSPAVDTTYTITCVGPQGTVEKDATVAVQATAVGTGPIAWLQYLIGGKVPVGNVDPLVPRVWKWESRNADTYRAVVEIAGCADESQNGTVDPWNLFNTANQAGGESSSRAPGESRYGCHFVATYVAKNSVTGEEAQAVAEVQFIQHPENVPPCSDGVRLPNGTCTTETPPQGGTCNASVQGTTLTQAPAQTSLCTTGTPAWVDQVGADGEYNWTCSGVACAAKKKQERIAAYQQLSADVSISTSRTLLSIPVTVGGTTPRKVLVQSDGRMYPVGASGVQPYAAISIRVDGVPVGDTSELDWGTSRYPVQHSYNVLGVATLAPGSHTVDLVAKNKAAQGSVTVGSGSNLSLLESSARMVHTFSLAGESASIYRTGADLGSKPVVSLGSLPNAVKGPAPLLFSGTIYLDPTNPAMGDAMIGIAPDIELLPSTKDHSWTVNDLWEGAELRAPVYSQGYYAGTGTVRPYPFGSVFPWGSRADPVRYRVARGATFVALEQPKLSGVGYHRFFIEYPWDSAYNATAYECGNSGWGVMQSDNVHHCPPVGTVETIASKQFTIPEGHDGVVLVQAKTRIQADGGDAANDKLPDKGGNVFLGITVDGVNRGSVGVQQIVQDAAESQRTLTASYLAAGSERLAPGTHTITAWFKTTGDDPVNSFKHATINKDLTLLYYD